VTPVARTPAPPLRPLIPESALVLGQGQSDRPWAVCAYERNGRPTVEARLRVEAYSGGHCETVGKSEFRVPDFGVVDQLATVDGCTRLVFGVTLPSVAMVRLELENGSVEEVFPQRGGLVATWPFDTFFTEVPATPDVAWVVATDATGDVLERLRPHGRLGSLGGSA
jgi:hypothetical protein